MSGDEVGVEPERLAELASALENLRDVLAQNVPIIVNTMERYWNEGAGTPVSLLSLKQAEARAPQDAAEMRSRSDMAQAWMNQAVNIDAVSSGIAYIPWDTADSGKADAQIQAQEFVAAEQSGNRAQVQAIEQDLQDHQNDGEWLAYFWSQQGVASAAGNLAAMLETSDGNQLTTSDQKLLTGYANSLSAAYNLGGLSTGQQKQLADGLAAVAAKDPGPVAVLLESADNAANTMSALATAIEDQDLKYYWEPGRLVPNWSNLIPNSGTRLTSDEEGALYFGTAGYLFSKYGIGYRTMLPGSDATPWPIVPRMDSIPFNEDITALGKQWTETKSGLLVPSGSSVDPRIPTPPDNLGAGWKTGLNSGLRTEPINVPKWADYSSKGLFIAGSALTLYSQWEQTWQDDESLHPNWSTGQRVADAAGQTAVVGGSTVAGAWAGAEAGAEGGAMFGAAVGSFFPGPGNLIGGIVGGVVGGVVGGFAGSEVGRAVGHSVWDAGKSILHGLGL